MFIFFDPLCVTARFIKSTVLLKKTTLLSLVATSVVFHVELPALRIPNFPLHNQTFAYLAERSKNCFAELLFMRLNIQLCLITELMKCFK